MKTRFRNFARFMGLVLAVVMALSAIAAVRLNETVTAQEGFGDLTGNSHASSFDDRFCPQETVYGQFNSPISIQDI